MKCSACGYESKEGDLVCGMCSAVLNKTSSEDNTPATDENKQTDMPPVETHKPCNPIITQEPVKGIPGIVKLGLAILFLVIAFTALKRVLVPEIKNEGEVRKELNQLNPAPQNKAQQGSSAVAQEKDSSEEENTDIKTGSIEGEKYTGTYVDTYFDNIQIKLPEAWDKKLYVLQQGLRMHQLGKNGVLLANISYVKLPKRNYTISQMNLSFSQQAAQDPALSKFVNKQISTVANGIKLAGHSVEMNSNGNIILVYKYMFKGPKNYDCLITVSVVKAAMNEMIVAVEDLVGSLKRK